MAVKLIYRDSTPPRARTMLYMAATTHATLTKMAEEQNLSMNKLCMRLLDSKLADLEAEKPKKIKRKAK